MKKYDVRKKEEDIQKSKRKRIFIYGVIALLSVVFIYMLTTYILTLANVINEGNFRINDFVITSKVDVYEIEQKIDEMPNEDAMQEGSENEAEDSKLDENSIQSDISNEVKLNFNISQENIFSILVPVSENATITKAYLSNMKIKGTIRDILIKGLNSEPTKIDKNRFDIDIQNVDNQYLIEFSLLNNNIIENATVPEGVDSVIYDGTILKMLNYDTNLLKYEFSARLNLEDSTGKTSVCSFSIPLPRGRLGENGIVIERQDVNKYNLKLKTKILEFFE